MLKHSEHLNLKNYITEPRLAYSGDFRPDLSVPTQAIITKYLRCLRHRVSPSTSNLFKSLRKRFYNRVTLTLDRHNHCTRIEIVESLPRLEPATLKLLTKGLNRLQTIKEREMMLIAVCTQRFSDVELQL
jgi:hypothetical protein